MNKPAERGVNKAVDSIQERLTGYACDLSYQSLSPEAIQAVKVRVIDTLGTLIGGFFGAPCHIARNLASRMPHPDGATVIGTRMRTTPDMAAFVNGPTARYLEANDIYYKLGSSHGHPSDVVMPLLAVGEQAQVSGREFITAIVLAYEIFLRISDVFHNHGFDHTNFGCIGIAAAAGKLLGLNATELSHCISMAVVPNNSLRQTRLSHLSMWKAGASGQSGRAGVFAALLARAGMEGPHLPFEGKAGWCDHVARERFSLNALGGNAPSFKVQDSWVKLRPCAANAMPSVLAAEKVAMSIENISKVKRVTVEVYGHAKIGKGSDYSSWNPDSPEAADHSIPYGVSAALMDGILTQHSFNDTHLSNPELRALMQRIEVVENEEFTRANKQLPAEHRARVTVVTDSGEQVVAESGGEHGDDVSTPISVAQLENKFRGLTEDVLGATRVQAILDCLWQLDDLANVADKFHGLLMLDACRYYRP